MTKYCYSWPTLFNLTAQPSTTSRHLAAELANLGGWCTARQTEPSAAAIETILIALHKLDTDPQNVRKIYSKEA